MIQLDRTNGKLTYLISNNNESDYYALALHNNSWVKLPWKITSTSDWSIVGESTVVLANVLNESYSVILRNFITNDIEKSYMFTRLESSSILSMYATNSYFYVASERGVFSCDLNTMVCNSLLNIDFRINRAKFYSQDNNVYVYLVVSSGNNNFTGKIVKIEENAGTQSNINMFDIPIGSLECGYGGIAVDPDNLNHLFLSTDANLIRSCYILEHSVQCENFATALAHTEFDMDGMGVVNGNLYLPIYKVLTHNNEIIAMPIK